MFVISSLLTLDDTLIFLNDTIPIKETFGEQAFIKSWQIIPVTQWTHSTLPTLPTRYYVVLEIGNAFKNQVML